MYQQGDKMLEVRELLVKAFATAWKNSDQSTDRDTYINSSITVIDSMQVQPEMIYAEEGQGLTDGEELDHLADLVRADGTWVYYGVPAENFFIEVYLGCYYGYYAARFSDNLSYYPEWVVDPETYVDEVGGIKFYCYHSTIYLWKEN